MLDFQTKDGNIKQSLKIDIKDLRDGDLHSLSNSNNSKIPSYSQPKCPKGLPVAAASIVFDYHLGKLTGQARVDILKKVCDFVDVDVKNLHLLAGKGHNTAFGFKDVITVTAGPGNAADAKQPGIVVSWQIGCGIDIPGEFVFVFYFQEFADLAKFPDLCHFSKYWKRNSINVEESTTQQFSFDWSHFRISLTDSKF